jgi:hypothetical protein
MFSLASSTTTALSSLEGVSKCVKPTAPSGRYALHYHLCRDTMRGSSVIGASIWDSDNRWLTVHGTEYLVVRDCVGYKSIGHGFFLEDGTEVYNVFDRNLAVRAEEGRPLPGQMLPFDKNEGAGFWWGAAGVPDRKGDS